MSEQKRQIINAAERNICHHVCREADEQLDRLSQIELHAGRQPIPDISAARALIFSGIVKCHSKKTADEVLDMCSAFVRDFYRKENEPT